MLTYLADFENIFGPLRLFRYLSLRIAFCGISSILIGSILGPWLIAKLKSLKMNQSIRTKDEVGDLANLHEHKDSTPTMGGLIICLSVSISVLLWAKLNTYVVVSLFIYIALTILGFVDDYLKVIKNNSKGLSSMYKLLAQSLISLVALIILLGSLENNDHIYQLWIPFYKFVLIERMPIIILFLLFFLIIVGSSNAINLTDGMDGLAIGCTINVVLAFIIIAYASGNKIISDYLFISYIPGSSELAVFCSAILGASLSFLWYNSYPAEIFMGDTGSLALGGVIGSIAFMVHQPFTLVIIGAIFVIEAISVILQVLSYKILNKRIFKMAPIHHHFQLLGWAENKIVIRFWIISLLFAIIGIASLKLR